MKEFASSPRNLLLLWLVVINAITFFTFGLDKAKARQRGARRIPQKTLFTLAAVGGSVGALIGMRVWHHKTLHTSFRIGIPLILAAQLLAAGGWYLYILR